MNTNRRNVTSAGLVALLVLVVGTGCLWTSRTGPVKTQSRTIELGGARSVAVDLRMGAGELTLAGGVEDGGSLAEATFTYNVDDWLPTVDYVVGGDEGELTIEQPEVETVRLDSYRYEWDLRLNEDVPMTLDVALGAGKSEIDVSALSITSVDLEMGVGAVTVDLTGDRRRDVDVRIRGGVGEATVLLPDDVGVRASVSGGLGDVEANGMQRDGNSYVNDAYGESEATIALDIEGGVGGIELKVVD